MRKEEAVPLNQFATHSVKALKKSGYLRISFARFFEFNPSTAFLVQNADEALKIHIPSIEDIEQEVRVDNFLEFNSPYERAERRLRRKVQKEIDKRTKVYEQIIQENPRGFMRCLVNAMEIDKESFASLPKGTQKILERAKRYGVAAPSKQPAPSSRGERLQLKSEIEQKKLLGY